jgi:hypothetical protein
VETGSGECSWPVRPRSLADSLRTWDDPSLAQLLSWRPDLLRPTPKDISALAARATSGPSTSRCLDGLTALDLVLLGTLVAGGSGHPHSVATARQATASAVHHREPGREGLDSSLRAAIDASLQRLRGLALVWGTDDDLRVTHAVRDALGTAPRAQWPPPQLEAGPAVGGCDEEGAWQATGFIARIRELLDEWGARPPAVLRTSGLGIREFAAARAAMHADVPSSALAIETAHAAGLFASDEESSPAFVPTDAYDDWLSLEPGQAWAILAEAWLSLPRLPGLASERANLLSSEQDRRAVIGMRREVLTVLAEAVEHGPVAPATISAVLDDRRPRGAGPLRQQSIEATLLEGTLLGVVASGALTTAGRALVTGSGSPAPAMAASMPATVDHVLVQADLTIIAPGPLPAHLQRTLGQVADIESTGHAFVYRLSAASVGRAIEAGLDAQALRDRLAEISRSPLPSTVTALIDDAGRRHGAVRVGVAQSYIRCLDPVLAATIAGDRSLARLGLSRVDEHLLVASVPASTLLPALRAAGYPVAGEAPDGSVLKPSRSQRRIESPPGKVQVRRATAGSIQAAVRALRAAEGAINAAQPARMSSAEQREWVEVDEGRRCTGPAAVALLRAAIEDAQAVWLAYAEADGETAERLADPIRVGGGTLTAFDHQSGKVQTFALARIASVAPVAATQQGAHP